MTTSTPLESLSDHLTVTEAAEFLGVSPSTLRNWDRSGKLKPRRHPLNRYRIYSPDDLKAIHLGEGISGKRKCLETPNVDWEVLNGGEHFVQFYESDAYLVESVVRFSAPQLRSGGAVLLLVTPEHRKRIDSNLEKLGFDIAAARQQEQYVTLDAAATLARLMDGSLPNPEAFMEIIGGVISNLTQRWPSVRAFGEMVALLGASGNRQAAVRLEELWNELGKKQVFSLFCAYPLKIFSSSEDAVSFHEVCGCHSHVIPAETFTTLATPAEQLREISFLQQKARALEAEIALRRQAEYELADFVENALEGLHKVGPDGRILWANKAELDMLGYEESEYIGRHVSEFHVDADVAADILTKLTQGENVLDHHARLRRKDGSIRHVVIHSNGYYKDGKLLFTRCFTRDVTESRKAERDRAKLAAIVDSSEDAIISKDLHGIITSWNRAAGRLFGYTEQEAIGQPVTMLIPDSRLDEEPQILSRIQRGERIKGYETTRRRKDGSFVEISLTVSPVFDARGQVIGASKIARDITRHKEAEARYRQSEDRYQQLAELMPVAVYTCEAPTGVITYYNPQAEVLWGRAPRPGDPDERFCGSFKLRRLDGTLLPHEECPMALAVQQGQSFRNQEVMVERHDGSKIYVLVNIEPICSDSGQITGAINVFLDMTALKRAEETLNEAARRKDEFLATMAHELRNPLAPLRHSLQLLQFPENSDSEVRQLHEIMERQVNHMVRLVDDLLDLSRISRGNIELRKEQVTLDVLISQAVEACRPICESAAHQLIVTLPEEPITLEGDPVRLVQVFTNLLNNAAKYSDRCGKIQVCLERDATEARISIKDSGIGIQPEMIPRVFEMFTQIPGISCRSQGGLGIGLHLVKNLVRMHGGSIEAHSDGIGHGSEFVVRLPALVSNFNHHAKGTLPVSQNEAQVPRHRILLVDDHEDGAAGLAKLLRRRHMEVHVVHDGQSALDSASIFSPSAVILDIGLPDISGYEVARRLRAEPQFRDTVLIALTGWGQTEDQRRAKEAGFHHHLVKPIEFKQLQSLLSSIAVPRTEQPIVR